MRFRNWLLPTLALAVASAGCGRQAPLSPRLASPSAASLQATTAPVLTEVGPKLLEGVIGPGALYRIDVPAEWNGDLVLYAHGYTLPTEPVAIPTNQDGYVGIRNLLLDRHYAVAVTSYSENGYAAAEAARQVRQLGGLFAELCGEPNRTFLMGQSFGGIVGLQLAEKHPGHYAGALLVSGVVGGTSRQVNYIGDVRVIFDCLWPGVLAGTVTDVPDGVPFPQNAILQCILTNQDRFGVLLCTFRDPRFRLPGTNGQQFVESALRVLGFQWLGAEDLFDRTHGHQLYDNDDVTFISTCAPDPVRDAINACFVRYSSTRDAENYMRHHYEPTGVLRIPVLTLHAEHDPVVPAGHEAVLQQKVAATGSLGNLLQCVPPRYGHTEAFQPSEVVQAFEALVNWVNTGQRPACPISSPS